MQPSLTSGITTPSRRAFLLILAVYLALAVGYSAVLPLGEAPDEADHYAYIVYLGVNSSLPVGPMVTQGKHPPLYHATAAALTAWTGLDFTFLRSNPDAVPLGPDKPPNFFIHTRLEAFPWREGALALHLTRLLSVALGAVTLWATWRLGLEVFPQRPAIGLIAAAFLAALPGFLFISASANNDNAAGAAGAVVVLFCAMTLSHGLHWGRTTLLGLFLGLGLLSKVGTLALWPLAMLAIGGAWWLSATAVDHGSAGSDTDEKLRPQRRSLLTMFAHLALAYGIGVLLAAPWLLRNWRLYGDPFGWELVRATVDQRVGPIGLREVGWLLQGFHPTFWGRFGGAGQVSLPGWAYALAAIFTIVIIFGAVRFLLHSPLTINRSPISVNHSLALHLTLLAAAPLLMFLSIYRYSAIALGTDQARLMWPALSALAVWVGVGVVGWTDWGRGRGRREGKGGHDGAVVAGFGAGMALFGLVVLLGVIRPAFAPPLPAMMSEASALAPLARFGDLELVGVELPEEPLAVGQPVPVRLLWRAAAPLAEDLRPALRLVHQDGWLAAEWSHSPAGGRYSTDRWRQGEVIADDYLVLPQPGSPGVFTVEVGVRPFGGDWLPPDGLPAPFAPLGQVIFE